MGSLGLGADAALRLEAFLDDRAWLTRPPTPHSHTPQPDSRNHDFLWLMMKHRHEEVAQEAGRPLTLAHMLLKRRDRKQGQLQGM